MMFFASLPWKSRMNPANSLLISRIEALLSHEPVDEVFITLPREKYGPIVDKIVSLCEEQGIIVRLWPNNKFQLQVARSRIDELFEGTPIITIQSGPADSWQTIAKRLVDILISLTLLLVLAPLWVLIALLIKLDSPGPVLFAQERVGVNKRRFRLLKFRSMVDGAEQCQHELEHLNEADGP